MKRITYFFAISFFTMTLSSNSLLAESCDSPRDSMQAFIANMDIHLQLQKAEKKEEAKKAITKAIVCFDLEAFPLFWRTKAGKESAYLMLEVIHRSWVINWNSIPGTQELVEGSELTKWIIPNTQIDLVQVADGVREGEYLFSYDAILNMAVSYEQVKDKPYLTDFAGTGYVEPAYQKFFSGWFSDHILGIRGWQWLALIVLSLVGYFIKPVLRKLILAIESVLYRLLLKRERQEKTGLGAPLTSMALVGFYYVGLFGIRLEGAALKVFIFLLEIVFSLLVIWLASRISKFVQYYSETHVKESKSLDAHMVSMLVKILKAFIVLVGILIAIQNVGINIVSLMAGLGLGGLALALAAKDTAANFFGSLMIMIDRPFKVGDWISVPGVEGDVEDVGIRSTKIRTFYNSVISVPNSVMASEKIDNLGARKYRRVKIYLGITYDSSPEKIEIFLEGLKKIIQANPTSKKDAFHVVFNDFGPSSLDILLYFFLKVPDWAAELVERQNIFLEILRLAKEVGVNFAYPSQSIYMEKPSKGETKMNATTLKNMQKKVQDFGPEGKNSRPSGAGIYTPMHQEE